MELIPFHYVGSELQNSEINYCSNGNIHSAKKFLDTYKSSIFTNIFHIRQIKSLLCEAGECPLHFDTKLEGIG